MGGVEYSKEYYEKNKARLLQNRKRRYTLNKEKELARFQEYYRANRKRIIARTTKRRKVRNRENRNGKNVQLWWKKRFNLEDVCSLYHLVRKSATINYFVKHNPTREEMWRRYRQMANDFKDIQRMKKAA